MKYVIDIDALKDCLNFTAFTKVNGKPTAFLDDVKMLIDKFPKDSLDVPKIVTREVTE